MSPALAALMKDVPADQLGDRIGTVVGTVGDAGLRSPDELVAIIGLDPATLETLGASPITGFDGTPPSPVIPPVAILMIVLAVIGALVPVAVFVSTATRLSAARREQRLAALRLVGATAGQVTSLAAVEALFVTIIGVVAGIGLFLLTRPLVAKIPLDNATWFPASIVPPLLPAIALLLAIPVVGVGAAVVALRRVVVTPLGVHRRQTPGMPGARRAIPLVRRSRCCRSRSGSCAATRVSTNPLALGLVGVAFGGVIVGIVLVGPWLTYLVGRVLHALPGGASMLLASRRLTDDPRASFGAIAGVIMAVFVASAFFSFVAYADGQEFDRAGVIAADQVYVEMPYNEGPPFAEVPARIAAVPGVRSVLPIATAELMEAGPLTAWVVPCVDLARQFGLPVGGVRRRLGQGARGRWRQPRAWRRSRCRRTVATGARSRSTVGAGRHRRVHPSRCPSIGGQLPQLIIEPDALAGRPGAVADQVLRHDRRVGGDRGAAPDDGPRRRPDRVRPPRRGEPLDLARVRGVRTGRRAGPDRDARARRVQPGRGGHHERAGTPAAIRPVAERRACPCPGCARSCCSRRARRCWPWRRSRPCSGSSSRSWSSAWRRWTQSRGPTRRSRLILAASLIGALAVVALMLPPLERLTRPETARAE